MKLLGMVDRLLPSDESNPNSVRHYRLRVALVACSAWVTLFLVVVPAFIPWIPFPIKVALAADLDQKIAAAVAPIQQATADAARAQQAQASETRALKLQLLERDIFTAVIEKCEAKRRGTGVRLRTERLQKLKADYLAMIGHAYDEPDCSDL